MTLTLPERARLRGLWRALATAALRPDGAGLAEDAAHAQSWPSPFEHRAEAFVLFALARLAMAVAKAVSPGQLAQRRPALTALALLALELLDAGEPAPPQLPFRADIDG